MSLKNRFDIVVVRNNISMGFSKNAYDYVTNLEAELELRKTALTRESQATDKLKRIEDVCSSIPSNWSIVGIEKIHEIEEIINEH